MKYSEIIIPVQLTVVVAPTHYCFKSRLSKNQDSRASFSVPWTGSLSPRPFPVGYSAGKAAQW